MLDQLLDLLDRDKRSREKRSGGLRGLIDRLGGDQDDHYRESPRERRNHEDDDHDDYRRGDRRKDRNDFDFD